MKPNLQDLDALIASAKSLRAAQADFEKKSAKARNARGATPKRLQALSSDMDYAAMHVERCWDTLHATAVDLGIAEPKELSAYMQRPQFLGAFHDHAYQPAMPRTIKERLTVGEEAVPTAAPPVDNRYVESGCQLFQNCGEAQ